MRWIRFRFKQTLRHRRHLARQWLREHPRTARALDRLGCLHVHQEAVARGVATGLFVGLTPTVGVQVLLIIFICWSLRANFPAAFAASWICNPLTIGPLYFAFHSIGEAILGEHVGPIANLSGLSAELFEDAVYMFTGSLFLAMPAAFAGYLLTTWLMRRKARPAGSTMSPV